MAFRAHTGRREEEGGERDREREREKNNREKETEWEREIEGAMVGLLSHPKRAKVP